MAGRSPWHWYFLPVFLVLIAPIVHSHHGFGMFYDLDDYISMEGTVTRFKFVNPHAFIYIDTIDEAGNVVGRWCETQSRTQLARKGLNQDSLTVGDRVTLEGFRARKDPLGCELAKAYLADGSVLVARASDGQAQYAVPQVQGDQSILGTWHRKAFPGAGSNPPPRQNLTATGEAAYADYNHETDYPTLRCSPVSPVHAWHQPGLPSRIRRVGDTIYVDHEFMNGRRTVHLDLAEHPSDIERTDMGHSIGRFEGSELVIDTAMFSAGNVVQQLYTFGRVRTD